MPGWAGLLDFENKGSDFRSVANQCWVNLCGEAGSFDACEGEVDTRFVAIVRLWAVVAIVWEERHLSIAASFNRFPNRFAITVRGLLAQSLDRFDAVG